jgi:hypothetical protein
VAQCWGRGNCGHKEIKSVQENNIVVITEKCLMHPGKEEDYCDIILFWNKLAEAVEQNKILQKMFRKRTGSGLTL